MLLNLHVAARRDLRPPSEREAILRQAAIELDQLGPTLRRDAALGSLRIDQAMLALDTGHLDESVARFEDARVALEGTGGNPLGVDVLEVDYLAAIPRVLSGDVQAGLQTMLDVARRARDAKMESCGVTAYRTTAATAIRVMEYATAEVGLREGLLYADEVEQSSCRSIMAATSAHVAWAGGQWDEAARIAELELVEPGSRRGIVSSRNALAFVALGRGLRERARDLLDEALAISRPSHESELILPALWGEAEVALLAGDPARALLHCEEALELCVRTNDVPSFVPFVVTGMRAALANRQPVIAQRWLARTTSLLADWTELAGPAIANAEGLLRLSAGTLVAARTSLDTAVAGWDARGRIWEATWARVDLATCLLRSNRHVEAGRLIAEIESTARDLGSQPLQSRAEELSRQARGRGADAELWYPLTAREFEVAQAIAEGKTNVEIATELFVSPKTVSAHIEHILAKLGASRRAEVASWVSTIAPNTVPAGG
jgi:DNA-binding CsgD family transcriptional regulator